MYVSFAVDYAMEAAIEEAEHAVLDADLADGCRRRRRQG